MGINFAMYAQSYDDYIVPHGQYINASGNSRYWVQLLHDAGLLKKYPFESPNNSLLNCPSDSRKITASFQKYGQYGYNVRANGFVAGFNGTTYYPGLRLTVIKKPTQLYIIMDKYFLESGTTHYELYEPYIYDRDNYTYGAVDFRHGNGANVMFADGHVKQIKKTEFPFRDTTSGGQYPWYCPERP
jgi:prepilin-type processing-associated H-X9-DG protein